MNTLAEIIKMNSGYKIILIVEDDISMRELLNVVLKNQYEVFLAEDGETALKILKEENGIRLILLDIVLPGINGLEVLKKIKEMPIEVGVIMMSIVKEVETVVEAMKLGAMDYITKEFDYDCFLKMIGKAFDEIEKKRMPELF